MTRGPKTKEPKPQAPRRASRPAGRRWTPLSRLPQNTWQHSCICFHFSLRQLPGSRGGADRGWDMCVWGATPQGWHTASHIAAKTRLFRIGPSCLDLQSRQQGYLPQNNTETGRNQPCLGVPIQRPREQHEVDGCLTLDVSLAKLKGPVFSRGH